MSTLKVANLHVSVAGNEILHGVDVEVKSGEVHALMGPNGSGKSTLSHALMGRSDYDVSEGSITIDGEELRGLPTWQRAQRGLFLAMQYPVAVPGVPLEHLVAASRRARGVDANELHDAVVSESTALGVRAELLARGVNDEFSGGEQKRAETVQLAVLAPKFAILDEIDSGLDVDSLRVVSRRVERMTQEANLGVLAITHYAQLLTVLRADRIHVLMGGRIVATGGPELADQLEASGYEGLAAQLGVDELSVEKPEVVDPFAEPGF